MTLIEIFKQYDYIGLRTCTPDEKYKIGDICRNSYDWDFENDCSTFDTENPTELYGTCCIDCEIEDYDLDSFDDVELLEELYSTCHNYGDGQKILIGGNYMLRGSDEGEIIIRDAIVLCIK